MSLNLQSRLIYLCKALKKCNGGNLPLPFTFSPSNPQIGGAAVGRAWLWACAGKVGKRVATFLDTYARELFRVVIHLWMFDSKNGIRTYLFHFFSINRYFVTFPRSICGSVASIKFDEFTLTSSKFHLFGFCIFPHFAWKSPVSQCELIN